MSASENLRYDLDGLLRFGRGSLAATCNYLESAFHQVIMELSHNGRKGHLYWSSVSNLMKHGTDQELTALYERAIKLAEEDEARKAVGA